MKATYVRIDLFFNSEWSPACPCLTLNWYYPHNHNRRRQINHPRLPFINKLIDGLKWHTAKVDFTIYQNGWSATLWPTTPKEETTWTIKS